MMRVGGPVLWAIAGLLASGPAAAGEPAGAVTFRSITTAATLDGQGDLRVVEELQLLAGGAGVVERTFALPGGATLRVERVEEVEADGAARPLPAGGPDGWSLAGLRLRLPARPAGAGAPPAARTLRLRYTLGGVLVRCGHAVWRLTHDFAPAERGAAVGALHAAVALDPTWRAASKPLSLERSDLAPGQPAVLVVWANWIAGGDGPGATAPAAVGREPWPPGLRLPLLATLAAMLLLAAGFVWWYGFGRGVFLPLPAPAAISQAWLEANVLAYPPEVIGAHRHGGPGHAEVTALLARMALEGKVELRRGRAARGHAPLAVHARFPLEALEPAERLLLEAIVPVEDRPANAQLAARPLPGGSPAPTFPRARVPEPPPRPWWPWIAGAMLAAAGAALCALAAARGEARPAAACALLALALAVASIREAARLAGRLYLVRAAPARIAAVLSALAAGAAGVGAAAWSGSASVELVLGAALLWAGILLAAAGSARTRASPAALERRRVAETAHRFFAAELRRAAPRLRDEWIPHLVALDLAPALDRWVKTHQAGARPQDPPRWTGGRDVFGDAGASAWAALDAVCAPALRPAR